LFLLCGSENGGDVSPVVARTPPRKTLQSQLSRCEDEEAEKARAAAAAADAMSPMQVRIGGVLESFSFFVHHHCIALFRFGDG
jgi:hypothetical protein